MLDLSAPCLPKQENTSISSSSGGTLPPIFPPTPTSANSDTQDFVHYFENRITPEYNDSLFLASSYTSLQSPAYTAMTMDSAYNSYFKHETMYPLPSCMHPTSLPLDGINSPHFDAMPPPLTPQSSFCSSNSPLSYISIHSPESAAMTPDLESARPISQGSMYSLGSPHIGDMAHTPLLTYSSSGSNCSSPLQHSSLDIAASLDLVARGGVSSYAIQYNRGLMTAPPLYPGPGSKIAMEMPYMGMATAYPPVVTPSMLAEGVYSAHDMNGYSQYDFDLLMSDPSELLTKCVSGEEEEVKPTTATGPQQLSSLQAQTPPALELIQ